MRLRFIVEILLEILVLFEMIRYYNGKNNTKFFGKNDRGLAIIGIAFSCYAIIRTAMRMLNLYDVGKINGIDIVLLLLFVWLIVNRLLYRFNASEKKEHTNFTKPSLMDDKNEYALEEHTSVSKKSFIFAGLCLILALHVYVGINVARLSQIELLDIDSELQLVSNEVIREESAEIVLRRDINESMYIIIELTDRPLYKSARKEYCANPPYAVTLYKDGNVVNEEDYSVQIQLESDHMFLYVYENVTYYAENDREHWFAYDIETRMNESYNFLSKTHSASISMSKPSFKNNFVWLAYWDKI